MADRYPLPRIDPVELMLAVIGIRPVISRAVERIKSSQLTEMTMIPSKVERMTRDLVHGDPIETTFGRDSYRDMLTDLARGWDPDQAEEMLTAMPSEYHVIGSALLVKCSALIKEMDKEYPVNRYITVTGETRLQPSDARMFRFLSVLECIDRPLVVFELMSTGALLQSQVEAIRTVYPSLAKAIDQSILDCVSRAKAAKQSFQLPYRAERGIRAWFGKGPVPLQQMKRAQETAKKQAQMEADKAAAQEQDKKVKQSQLTSVQRSETV